MSVIRVPTPLRPYTEGQKEIQINGGTVGEALKDLADRYPSLKPHLFDETGSLRPYVNLFLNDEDVRELQGESTPLSAEDRLMIVPSIAGGW